MTKKKIEKLKAKYAAKSTTQSPKPVAAEKLQV